MCPNASKSAIQAYGLRENAREKLIGEHKEPSPSIFFSSLLEATPIDIAAITIETISHRMYVSFHELTEAFRRPYVGRERLD